MNLQFVPCPLCGSSKSFSDVTITKKDGNIHKYGSLYDGQEKSSWKVCENCGFVRQNPRPTAAALNQFYMQAGYHEHVAPKTADEHLEFAQWYFGEKIDFTLRHTNLQRGRVFDIGCGRGGVLKLYEMKGWSAFGVEPDGNLANYAIRELSLAGVKQGILDSRYELQDKVDLVFTNHAFEHFADLDEVMRGIQKITKIGGYLFIAIPTYFKNHSSLSLEWMNSSHYSLFTHRSLGSLLAKYGFEEVVHTYSGWKKEVDDLWYLARFTGNTGTQTSFFEDPQKVARYLSVVNPLRSFFYYPIYSHWVARVRAFRLLKILVTSPGVFFQKLCKKFGRESALR